MLLLPGLTIARLGRLSGRPQLRNSTSPWPLRFQTPSHVRGWPSCGPSHEQQTMPSPILSARKRSYRRALVRCQREGSTWYKCQHLTLHWSRATIDVYAETQARHCQPSRIKVRCTDRLKVLSWNCGRLTSPLYAELLTWAMDQQADVLAVQETHWHEDSEYVSGQWVVVGSGAKDKSSGCLLLLSTKRFQQQFVRVRSVVPGRVLHVVAVSKGVTWHFVNVYQKPCLRTVRGPACRPVPKLGRPVSDQLVLMGDFNTNLHYHPSLIVNTDQSALQTLIVSNNLVVLTTHGSKKATFCS